MSRFLGGFVPWCENAAGGHTGPPLPGAEACCFERLMLQSGGVECKSGRDRSRSGEKCENH